MNCRGVALLTGLLLLAAISLLAVTAAGGMTLQRQQVANYEDRALASTRAALAESHATAWLLSRGDTEREAGCSQNCLVPAGIRNDGELPDAVAFESESWWQANAFAAGTHPATGEAAGFPAAIEHEAMWLAEEIHFQGAPATQSGPAVAGVGYYRILARGRGRHARSVTVSESIIARPWGGEYEPAAYPPIQPPDSFCGQFDPSLPCGRLAWRQRR